MRTGRSRRRMTCEARVEGDGTGRPCGRQGDAGRRWGVWGRSPQRGSKNETGARCGIYFAGFIVIATGWGNRCLDSLLLIYFVFAITGPPARIPVAIRGRFDVLGEGLCANVARPQLGARQLLRTLPLRIRADRHAIPVVTIQNPRHRVRRHGRSEAHRDERATAPHGCSELEAALRENAGLHAQLVAQARVAGWPTTSGSASRVRSTTPSPRA